MARRGDNHPETFLRADAATGPRLPLPEEVDETQILAALLGIAEMVGDLTDTRELLEAVVRIAPSLVRVDRCAIFGYDEVSREFRTIVFFAPPDAGVALEDLRIPDAEMPRLAQRLVALHLPALVKAETRDPTLPPSVVKRLGLQSVLLVPLVCRGRTLGLLWLDHAGHNHYFTSTEINVAQGIATSLAVALDRAEGLEALTLERRRFDALARTLADGVLILDSDLRILEMNRPAEDLLGWQSSEVRGRRASEVFAITEAQAGIAWTREAAGPLPATKTLGLRTRDRETLVCDVLVVPVRGEAGDIVQILFILLRAADQRRPDARPPALPSRG